MEAPADPHAEYESSTPGGIVNASPNKTRRMLSPRLRRAVLTAHIIVSVGLLGDAAAFLAVSVRAARTASQSAQGESTSP
ncbi:MAG: hypothetical protein ACRDLZ_03165 [Gaiellaceae bacterium]